MTAPVYEANSGGPMSRTRREPIRASLLGDGGGPVRFGLVVTLGLDFGLIPSRVDFVSRLLAHSGFDGAEALRSLVALPRGRLVAREAGAEFVPLRAESASWQAVLEQALWLGLCTAHLFDPERPVLWTEASLGRRLDLYRPEGFYA